MGNLPGSQVLLGTADTKVIRTGSCPQLAHLLTRDSRPEDFSEPRGISKVPAILEFDKSLKKK